MKHLRMFGLAVTAAAALMALAAPASANPVLTSPAGTAYMGEVKASASGSLTLQAGFATITCTESTASGTVETNNTTHASGKISTLTFGSCGTLVKVISKGSLTAAPGGKVTAIGSEVTVSFSGTSCVYGGGSGTVLGTLSGGTPASLTINATLPRISGGFGCANSASWTGKYTVTTPSTLLVDSPPPVSAPVLTSPAGTAYTGEINASATGSLLLQAGFSDITCSESTASGKVETNNTTHASGKIATLTFGGCGATVKVISKGSLTAAPGGKVTASGSEVTVERFGTSCIYGGGAGTTLGTLSGGTPATLTINATLPRISGGFGCANPATWTGKYTVTTPSTLLVD